MKPDDVYRDWLARGRSNPPPDGLTDRIMAVLPPSPNDQPVARPTVSIRSWLGRRVIPYVLWCAAAVVCAVRVYSVMNVIIAPVATNSDETELKGTADERHIAS
ncbi:MAG TPA: hypothetical protein VM165_08290 [Planctomycetaceae bacterium]|nr:hypothetical protein [Planctomycetaceae bacterium]